MYSSGPETSISRMRGLLADNPCHLIQHGEAHGLSCRGKRGSASMVRARYSAEAGVEEVIVVSDLETGFGEEVGEILLEILVNALKTGSRVASGGPTRRGAGGVCAFLDQSGVKHLHGPLSSNGHRWTSLARKVAPCNAREC